MDNKQPCQPGAEPGVQLPPGPRPVADDLTALKQDMTRFVAEVKQTGFSLLDRMEQLESASPQAVESRSDLHRLTAIIENVVEAARTNPFGVADLLNLYDPDQAIPSFRMAIMEVLDRQLQELDPPETATTLKRLLALGIDLDEARRLIGLVLMWEYEQMKRHQSEFDIERFISALNRLPAVPE